MIIFFFYHMPQKSSELIKILACVWKLFIVHKDNIIFLLCDTIFFRIAKKNSG